MSRVRILNLPNNITEDDVRQFILTTVPADAPRLDITDITIVRSKNEKRGSAHNQRGRGRGGARTSCTPTVRMVFVGFVSASSGHYVVKFFDKTYFRSAKITVELAKGLNEVGVTTNMQKKLAKAQDATAASTAGKKRDRSPGEHDSAPGAREAAASDGPTESEAPLSEAERRQKRRREAFIDERTKETEGPAWAAELLIPHANGTSSSSVDAPEPRRPDIDALDTDALVREALREKQAAEEAEREALAKQRALGEVSDLDFLAQLGGGSTGSSGEKAAPATAAAAVTNEEEDATERGETHDVSGTSAAPSTAQPTGVDASKQKAKKKLSKAEVAAQLLEEQTKMARVSCRVRIGNLPYLATEDQVKQFAASTVGPVAEVHIPLTKDTKQSKGAAFVRFVQDEDAVRALTRCRGAIFMGRLLRVSAAEEDPHSKRVREQEAAAAATSAAGGGLAGASAFKKDREKEARAAEAAQGGNGLLRWNTMYMNSHAAVETMAQRLGVRSGDVVGVDAKGAAVRAAIAEAYLTSEVQTVLGDEGVSLDVIGSAQENLLKPRSNTTMIVKNIQLKNGEEAAELAKLFARFGSLETSVFPAAGSFALFRFYHPQDARIAFTRLAYKSFHNAPLFLEWAPVGAIIEDAASGEPDHATMQKPHNDDDDDSDAEQSALNTSLKKSQDADQEAQADANKKAANAVCTLFITNLPFAATEDEFYAYVVDQCPRLAKAPDQFIKRLVYEKDQGRAFLSLADQSTMVYCQAKLHNRSFAGRTLSCVVSKQTAAALLTKGAATIAADGAASASHSLVTNKNADDDDEDDHLNKGSAVIARSRTHGGGGAAANTKVPPGCDPLRLIVKNLPFEATEKDVRELFSAFSEVRSVRVPTKRHSFTAHRENNHRGFAFVEFMSETEAARALETLKATHLYGRHLVLQYAKLE